ncbi:MAG TPA: hypothetical protein VG826_23345 [Pirellulales bacterium]|nr:hypothetical protein [Pirellulales bacterium]
MATSETGHNRPGDVRASRDQKPQTPWQRFYRRYSGHGELPRSSLASLGFHLLLAFLMILMSGALIPKERTPPVVDTVRVSDDSSSAAGDGDGLEAAGDAMEAMEPADALTDSDATETAPTETVQTEVVQDTPPETNTPTADDLLAEAEQGSKRVAAASQRAKAAMQRAKDKLKQNMSKGLGSGTGGGGGSGPTGRAARPARWVLHFNTSSVRDYLAQYEGLGAKLAFPAENDKFRYFSNLTSQPPTSELRDLSNEGRLFWVDESRESVARVAAALGAPRAESFLAFLPMELEERMLKLELDAAGVPEDQIASTHFVVVPRGGSYEVQVLKQTLK